MTAEHAYELPPPEDAGALADALRDVEGGEVVILTRNGRPVGRVEPIDSDQAWFWTEEWQAKEREVDEDLAAGVRGRVFHSDEEFLAAVDAAVDDPSALT